MLPPSASGHIFRAPDGSYYDSSGRKIPVPEGATMTGGAGSRAPKSILVKDAEGNVTFSGLATQLAPDEWVDAGGEHVDTKGMKVTPLSGASGVTAANMNQRIMYGANEVQRAIDNMTQMPIGSTLGWFGGAQAQTAKTLRDGLTKGLANTITPRSAQMMAAMARGIDRGLAQLAGAGAAQGLQALSEQMKGEIPAAGDDGFTVLTKFANMRQIIEASNETLQANDLIGDKQKALMETVTQRVRKSVPWTVSDVVAITSDPSEERIRDFAAKIGVAGAKGGEGGATGARYNPGDVIDKGGKKYRVTGGNPSDPDVEEIK
jgi:hypothetical protein